ncbi:MAG: hypothetical protein WKF34_13205 [Pyrinomonadaceae bacterium]
MPDSPQISTSPGKKSLLEEAVEIAFLALIFSLGFMRPNFSFGTASATITDILFLITGGLWIASLVAGIYRFRFDKFYWLLGLYGVGLTLSALFSVDTAASLRRLPIEIYLISLSVFTCSIVSSMAMLRRVAFAWMGASVAASIIGVAAIVSFYLSWTNALSDFALHHYGSLPPGNYPRIQGTFEYPSLLCNYLTVGLMFVFIGLKLEWLNMKAAVAATTLISFAIAFTFTPGIGGAMLAAAMWYWLVREKRVIGRLALGAGILAFIAFLIVSTFTPIATSTSPFYFHIAGWRIDPTQRLLTWMQAGNTFLGNAIFGKGLGQPVASVHFLAPSGQHQILSDAHNVFLNVAGQSGLAGLIPLILICWTMLRRSMSVKRDGSLRWAGYGLGIALFSVLIAQGAVGSFENSRHIWVLIGLILAVDRLTRSGSVEQISTV